VERFVQLFSACQVCRKTVLIFLTVGNWHKGFDRLVKGVDQFVATGAICDTVYAQVGYGKYRAQFLETVDFCGPQQFEYLIAQATIIIAHAGVGTIIRAIDSQKPIVVVPRKAVLREHYNDHQFDTARELEKEGKILVAYEVSQLPSKVRQARSFHPVVSRKNNRIIRAVKEYIETLAQRKQGGCK